MKFVITGGTGYLGKELVRKLLEEGEQEIFVASSDVKKAYALFDSANIKIISNDNLLKVGSRIIDEQCIIVHASFCRQSVGTGLVQSLNFTQRFFQLGVECNVAGILNLSSQSVYGGRKKIIGDESLELNPGYLYALAKFASEELLNEAIYFSYGKTAGCNVRMASLIGPTDLVPKNVMYKFIIAALSGQPITIVGGKQRFSFLDVRDAADVIIKLIHTDPNKWKSVYNLGPLNQTDIVTMAELICDKSEELTGKKVEIIISPEEGYELNAGMDSSALFHDLQWKPARNIENIIEDTIHFVYQSRMNN